MKHYTFLSALVVATLATMTSCTDDPLYEAPATINYRGEPVNAFLNITVGDLSVSMETRAEGDDEEVADPHEDSEAERWVNDLWIFQYNVASTYEIADPIYLTITNQETLKNLPVTLSDNEGDPSLVYVLTNTGDSSWGKDGDFTTVAKLEASALPSHEPIILTATTEVKEGDLSIPMEGNSGSVEVTTNKVITVPVTRMYAKLMIDPIMDIYIDVDVTDEYGDVIGTETIQAETVIYSVSVGNIPLYCRVGTLWNDDSRSSGAEYPNDVQWISRAFEEEENETKDGETSSGAVPAGEDLGYRYIMYVPENLQGQGSDKSKLGQEQDTGTGTIVAPAHALQIDIVITYFDPDDGAETHYPYTVYPGADTAEDYNIKRNNVYRVKVNINELSLARVPSANCLVAIEGETISFYPYYRVETGGGYNFTDYLDPYGAEDAQIDRGAKIDHVGIIWQTKDCIGDNSKGDRVYLNTNSATHTGFEQIHVKTLKEGNALIGAYDTEDNIIWSWHIWVRTAENGDPTHPANALVYYTYDWDANGIYGEYQTNGNARRVPGYEIMACNLGALQDKPNWDKNTFFGDTLSDASNHRQIFMDGDGIVRTFGMLYQWGRKDPFPPMTTTEGARGNGVNAGGIDTGFYTHDYNDDHTETHYGNDNSTAVHKTSYGDDSYLFHTHVHDTSTDVITGMRYSIAHPTVFLSGVKEIARTLESAYGRTGYTARADSTNYVKLIGNYVYGGAWSDEDHDSREWGGLEPSASMKYYNLGITYDDGEPIVLYDDYEDDTGMGSKSIFDPCPYGWRVGSGDLWLGFTKSGINTNYDPWDETVTGAEGEYGSLDNVNFDLEHSCFLGMSMYLGNGWRTGETSWFPNQGFRIPDGCAYRVGGCGNYVNANTSANDRVNIIHIHCQYEYFKQFETQLFYTTKSTGNPLRCVRDTK